MLPKYFLRQLLEITPIERKQIIEDGRNIPDVFPSQDVNSTIIKMPFWDFFDHGKISVTKSNRFSYIPAHTHSFIEMNYVLSGSSHQYIDDQKVVLHPGQLLIMDRDVQQRINYAGKDDLLINILVRDDDEINQLLSGLTIRQNLMCRFLFNAAQPNFNHDNYLICNCHNSVTATNLIEAIIINGWQNNGQHNQILQLLTKSLLLATDNLVIQQKTNFIDVRQDELLPVINYLNTHFQTITLSQLATHFGYNPNYLGDKIKHTMGRSFKEILQLRRLNIACNLMEQTNMSMHEISAAIGYENHSSIFRLFKDILHTTPTEYRQRVRHPRQLDIDLGYFSNYDNKNGADQ
ncbi:AraC family transcriptional regulator [uncultured Limosilactobacillus sp.]|uniref:AraC family transcriptional regulator n=1 Tax=uncultured Limosilactobacillus sp. TaxID=2837629 RepID=UPI0025D43CC1|nr:AraC family transcriptional regulator [uncultured Limosilactobacillus sp.]